MASSPCALCSRRSKESIAIKFCSDCEEAMCGECVDVHSTIKALANHHIIDITLANDQAFTVDKMCNQHSGMLLELYCSDHDKLCCRSCMADDHRTCKKLVPVDIASMDVKQSTMFDDISECIGNLNKTADELETQEKMLSATLKNSKDVVLKRVSDMKVKLLQQIAQLETQILSEVETVFASLSDKTANNKKVIGDHVKVIKEMSSRFDFVVNHGSMSQIFYLLHATKLNIHETGQSVEELILSLTSKEIVFKESDLLSIMKTFGSVNITEKPCNIQYKSPKTQQAQILQTSITIKNLELEKTVNIPSTGNLYISCIAVTKDNRLILCKWNSNELIVLTDEGQHIKNITLSSRPWGIAIVPDTEEAWVTLPPSTRVQVVNTVTYSLIRHVNVPAECYGITMIGDDVVLGGNGKVYIINKQGVRLKELSTGTGYVHSLCVNSADKLYCCAANEGKFLCIKLDGSKEFPDSSQELDAPVAVITDLQRNLYVIGYKSNNLKRFSADEKFHEIMLTRHDGLNAPATLAFNRNYSKMFVANSSDRKLFNYCCK